MIGPDLDIPLQSLSSAANRAYDRKSTIFTAQTNLFDTRRNRSIHFLPSMTMKAAPPRFFASELAALHCQSLQWPT